jgi:hypothetical protein
MDSGIASLTFQEIYVGPCSLPLQAGQMEVKETTETR